MKFASMLAVSAVLALAPVAQAQISCAQGNDLIDKAVDEFASISGDEVEDGVYDASYILEGAEGCRVTSDFSVAYSCLWTFDTLAAAQSAYGLQSQALANCYGDWDREALTADSGDTVLKTLDGASFYTVDDDDAELTWIAYLQEHTDADTHDWHVWVVLDYF